MKLRSTLKRFVVRVNLFFVLLSAVGLVSYWVDTNIFGTFAVIGFLNPVLNIVHLGFLFFWSWRKSKWVLLSLGVIVISLVSFDWFYAISSSSNRKTADFSILNYNAMNFNKWKTIPIEDADQKIIQFIKKEDPDILCLQEHSRIQHRRMKQFKYRAETPYSTRRSIQAIFSKYPILNKGSLEPEGTNNNIIFADVAFPTDTVRIYNVHFQSFRIVPSEENLTNNKPVRLAKKIRTALNLQLDQVGVLREHLKKSPYRTLVCGDFNATQFSNVYRMASKGLQDTYLQKGKGWGQTYSLRGLPLRIDYILADSSFQVLSHQNYKVKYSDHYPLMAGLNFK